MTINANSTTMKNPSILIVLLLCFAAVASAQTTVGGTISSDETYTAANSPYTVTSSLTVNAGVTLTVESGVELRFNDNLEMQVNGTLVADGATFTSSNSSPTAGIWSGIDFANSETQTLTNCQVLYAVNAVEVYNPDIDLSGSSFTSTSSHAIYVDNFVDDLRNTITADDITITGAGTRAIFVDRANLTLSNSTLSNVGLNGVYFSDDPRTGETVSASSSVSNTSISNATAGGIVFNGGTVSVTDVTFSNNYFPLEFINEADVTYAGTNTFSNNDFEAVWMNFSTINQNFTMRDASIPFYMSRSITVANTYETIIESGSILKFGQNVIFEIEGKLTADAATDEDIIFTSWSDDNEAGDTNGDSNDTSPDSRRWYGIHFEPESDDTSSISGATLKWVGFYGAIRTNAASPTIDDCFITNSRYGGEFIGASSPVFSNNEIAASDRTPIAMTLDANPSFLNNSFSSSDNEFDAIGLIGSVLTRDNTLPIRNFTDIENVTYVLLGSVDIPVGTSLTIDPGVVIKTESGYNIEVQGELIADGAEDAPIVFTSVNDDNFGNPLDTRNDGTDRVPAIGNFGGIYFGENALSTSLLDSVVIKFARYGANYQVQAPPTSGGSRFYNYDAAIAINRSAPTISNTQITDTNYGIDMRGLASPVLTDNEIVNTQFAPFRQAVQTTPVYTGNTFSSVGWKGVAILPEFINYTATLSQQTVAGFDNILYIITDMDINEGAEVTISEGIFIKMDRSDYIEVWGGLNLAGTSENPITITTIADDNTGPFTDPLDNDTESNGNATDPTSEEWASIIFYETSDDAFSNISHTSLLYGGNDRAPIWWRNAAASVDNVDISFSQNYGLYFEGASTPDVSNTSISTSNFDPLAMSYFANPTFTDITFDANGSNGIRLIDANLNSDATISKRDIAGINNIAYVMTNLTIGNGATLTINPGVVLKFFNNGMVVGEGAIQAIGSDSEKIIFTSLNDDSRGGDTNIDGNGSVPGPGNWYGLSFFESTVQSTLQNCEFRYGGDASRFDGLREGTIISENNNLSVESCLIQLTSSSAFGIYGTSTASITDNQLENVSRFPVHLSMFSNPTFSGNSVENVAWFALGIQDESYNQTATFPFRNFAGVDSVTYYPVARSGAVMTINSGTKITIPPGMHFKSTSETIFEVNGELHIAGTAEDPVVFTEFDDDEYGRPRDTENDGLPTGTISRHGLLVDFNNISDDNSIIEHAIIRYKNRAVQLESASPTLDNNLIEFSNYGVGSAGISEPVYTNNTFKDLDWYPFSTSLVAYPEETTGNSLQGTTWKVIHINEETLTQDTTLFKRSFAGISNIPYFFNDYTVGLGVKMTIEPGVILKFGTFDRQNFSTDAGSLTVQGALEAQGGASTDESIIFTTMTDDFYGGDSNADSTFTTSPFRKFDGISFTNESSDSESIIDNAIIRYSNRNGVTLESASPTISNTLFWQNGNSSNEGGLLINGASNPTLSNNDFVENQSFGISNTGTFTVDATGSWWGDNSGPFNTTSNPDGEGDVVLGNVTFDPWATDNAQNPVTGDVSLNGVVSAYDAALTLQDVAAIITFEARQDRAGDVSGDGSVSAMDASYILQFAAGLIQSFPAEAENKRPDDSFAPTDSEIVLSISNGLFEHVEEEVGLELSLGNVRELYAFSMVLPMDESLEFIDFELNEALDFTPTLHYSEATHEFRIAFAGMKGLKGDMELGTLKVGLKSDISSSGFLAVAPTQVVGNESDVTKLAVAGEIRLSRDVLSVVNQSFEVYPNPISEVATFTLPNIENETITLKVVDLSGSLIHKASIDVRGGSFDWSNPGLETGLYVIQLETEKNTFQQKVIIRK